MKKSPEESFQIGFFSDATFFSPVSDIALFSVLLSLDDYSLETPIRRPKPMHVPPTTAEKETPYCAIPRL